MLSLRRGLVEWHLCNLMLLPRLHDFQVGLPQAFHCVVQHSHHAHGFYSRHGCY